MRLRNKKDKELKLGPLRFNTPIPHGQRAATSKWSEGTDRTEDDAVETIDFHTLSFKEGLRVLMESIPNVRVKDSDQDDGVDEYIFE